MEYKSGDMLRYASKNAFFSHVKCNLFLRISKVRSISLMLNEYYCRSDLCVKNKPYSLPDSPPLHCRVVPRPIANFGRLTCPYNQSCHLVSEGIYSTVPQTILNPSNSDFDESDRRCKQETGKRNGDTDTHTIIKKPMDQKQSDMQ